MLTKESKKQEEQKTKISKFVAEVVSVNEALVSKINLLQDKERSRLKDKDEGIKHLLQKSNSSRALDSPKRTMHNSNRQVFEDLGIDKPLEKNK
eukprot:CAMPEP_0116922724 /NCGR_PEP_ID=MMETSP0467-20121206/22431_1 /TAXON_ID=283647 /ORGANISM="Mesodinium pulex, Strain SPMC105" /LENGTH=93 /DNA_ID=CAMNT_0004601107 /DNA_START=845 /DNA_END=1126 /DNA_ORIENTATION=+